MRWYGWIGVLMVFGPVVVGWLWGLSAGALIVFLLYVIVGITLLVGGAEAWW